MEIKNSIKIEKEIIEILEELNRFKEEEGLIREELLDIVTKPIKSETTIKDRRTYERRLEELFNEGFLKKQNKKIIITEKGRWYFKKIIELQEGAVNKEKIVKVEHHKIMSKFFKRIFNLPSGKFIQFYIICPWISTFNGNGEYMKRFCMLFKMKKIPVTIITRYPSPSHPWHKEAIDMLLDAGAVIYYNSEIHAKILIALTQEGVYDLAVFSTANVTSEGDKNNDVALFINRIGIGSQLIDNLLDVIYSLKTSNKIIKEDLKK